MRDVDIQAGDEVGRAEIENVIAKIYSTKAFEYVTYEMEGAGEPYNLVITCKMGPVSRFGLGLRADSEEIMAMIGNFGLNVYGLYGSKLNLIAKVGSNPFLEGYYIFDGLNMPTINVGGDLKWYNIDMLNDLGMGVNNMDLSTMGLKYFTSNQKAYISNMEWKIFDVNFGLKNKYFKVRSLSNEMSSSAYIENLDYTQFNNNYLSLFLNGRTDTLDDGYFPHRGFTVGADYEWVFYAFPRKIKNFHVVSADAKGVVPICKSFDWIPSAAFRFVLGGTQSSTRLAYANFIGGSLAGRYFHQQLALLGLIKVIPTQNILTLFRSDFRVEVAKNHYLSGIVNYARSCYDFREYVNANSKNYVGCAIEYAYDSIIGPLRADFHWSNANINNGSGGLGFYVGIGFNF